MSKPEPYLNRILFGLLILLIFSLGSMKPAIDVGFALLTPTDFLFPFVLVAWVSAIATGRLRFQWRFEYWVFGFYLLAFVISSAFSVNPRLSFTKLAGAIYLVVLAFLAASIVTTFDRLKITILAWLAGAVIPLAAGLVGVVLFYTMPESGLVELLTYHYGAVPVGNFPRISSTFVSASMLCNYLTVTIVMALVAARLGWTQRRLAVALTLAIGSVALFTVSMAIGGVFLAAGLWLWIDSERRAVGRAGLVLGGLIAIAFLAISPFALSRQIVDFSFDGAAPSSRLLVWRDALTTFFSDPFTGKGVGTGVANITFQNSDGSWSLLTDAHNVFLSVAAQAGIPGLIGIILIVVVTLRASFSPTTGEKDRYIRLCLGAAFFSAFVYEGITGSFEDARHLWVLIGLILAARSMRVEIEGSGALDGA